MRFKDGVYYAVAGLLLLASIPFYRLIFKYAVHPNAGAAESAPLRSPEPARALAAPEPFQPAPRLVRPLASNERCVGDAIVRVEKVAGVPTYTQVMDGASPARCPPR